MDMSPPVDGTSNMTKAQRKHSLNQKYISTRTVEQSAHSDNKSANENYRPYPEHLEILLFKLASLWKDVCASTNIQEDR